MKFIENMIYRMAVYLLAWSLLRFDKRHGGKHQNLTSGCTFVTVFGKEHSIRWLLAARRIPSDETARFEQLTQRMDRAEEREAPIDTRPEPHL